MCAYSGFERLLVGESFSLAVAAFSDKFFHRDGFMAFDIERIERVGGDVDRDLCITVGEVDDNKQKLFVCSA